MLIFPKGIKSAERRMPGEEIRELCLEIFRDTYPADIIDSIKNAEYNPIIVGYEHEPSNLSDIKEFYARLRKDNPAREITVAIEIFPQQLRWVEEFLEDEEEFNKTGLIKGQAPLPETIKALREYRAKLSEDHGGNLVLWLTEKSFNLISIEHEEVLSWIGTTQCYLSNHKDEEVFLAAPILQFPYSAISRDQNGLKIIDSHHPDVISVGVAHAIKYDILLQRAGERSVHFQEKPYDWSYTTGNSIIGLWRTTHEIYSEPKVSI